MHWSADYVGLPFLDQGRDRMGVDCWGLVRLVFSGVLNIDLPSYTERYVSTDEVREVAALVGDVSAHEPFRRVQVGREFDVPVFAAMGHPIHVGVVVKPGLMLHVSAGFESRVESYRDTRWASRLVGFYRHSACP